MNAPRTRLYRDKVEGKIMGVCAGIGDYVGVDPIWIRVAFVLLTLSMGWPLLAYILLAMLAPKKPASLYGDRQEQKFWQGVRQSPTRSAREIRSRFRDIDRRLADVEEHYVASNTSLSNEIEQLR